MGHLTMGAFSEQICGMGKLALFAPVERGRVQPTVIRPTADEARRLQEYDLAERERRAWALARVEVRRCVENLKARGRVLTPQSAEGLVDIVRATVAEVMGTAAIVEGVK